jgi:hypothetical protein
MTKQAPFAPRGTFSGSGDDRASDDDRAYFAAHPHTSARIRPSFAGEGPKPGVPAGTVVIVTQLRPGVRVRRWLLPKSVEVN